MFRDCNGERRMQRLTLFLMALMAANTLCCRAQAPLPADPARKMAWCHYVPWQSWSSLNKAYDAYYDPPAARPTGDAIADYKNEIQTAQNAGVDGFLVDIVFDNHQTNYAVLTGLLKAAAGSKFLIGCCLDGSKSTPEQVAQVVAKILQQHKGEPNLAMVNGKLVCATFWSWRLAPQWWDALRAALQKQGTDIFVMGDPGAKPNMQVDKASITPYAGRFEMLSSFAEPQFQGAELAQAYAILADASRTNARAGKVMLPITTGYLGAWGTGRNQYYLPFRGVDTFWETWTDALQNKTDWVCLTTWNDLDETPQEPTLFQFHTYSELNKYWINQWRGTPVKAPAPRVYAAYQREQMLGTLERIEIVSLPTSAGPTVTVSGALTDLQGKALYVLPALAMSFASAERREWLVPTAKFGSTPILNVTLRVRCGTYFQERSLPAIVLRTGWIANQVVVKVPLHAIAPGQAALQIASINPTTLRASVSFRCPVPVRSAQLLRNDKVIGAFAPQAPAGTLTSLRIDTSGGHSVQLDFTGATVLDAAPLTGGTTNFSWTAARVYASNLAASPLGVQVLDAGSGSFTVTIDGKPAGTLILADLVHGPQLTTLANGLVRVSLAKTDPQAAAPPLVNRAQGTLSGTWRVDKQLPDDLFWVRLETTDGRVLMSPLVAPFAAGAQPLSTTILQTATALDTPTLSAYFSPPTLQDSLVPATAHPGLLQGGSWNFEEERAPGADSLGRNPLVLGGGLPFFASEPSRVPQRVAGGHNGGFCLQFDGVNDRAQMSIRQQPLETQTFSCYVWPDGYGAAPENIVGNADTGNRALHVQLLPNGRISAGRDGMAPATTTQPLPASAWSKVTVTLDGVHVRLFVNDQLAGSAPDAADFLRYANSIAFLSGPDHPFRGKLDDVSWLSYIPPAYQTP